ncbi:MAG: STAS domain-containing protein [Bacteroidota bacterium]|jgi:anti-anti-sigma factor
MINTRVRAYGAYLIIEAEGRIDGLTSSTVNKLFEQAAEDGNHNIVVDFSAVSYISSAGLRVFLQAQKKLKPVGGEVILLSMQETAVDVFRISGMHNLFRMISSLDELGEVSVPEAAGRAEEHFVSGDGIYEWEFRDVPDGKYSGIGNAGKLNSSGFSRQDIVTISQSELQFAAGLGSVGETVQDYCDLFGESLVAAHNFFGYPAAEQPAVDYAWYSKTYPGAVHFLHGFRFSGEFGALIRFDSADPLELLAIARKSAEISGKDFFGLVLIAKSAGIYGLNLKKTPWQEKMPNPPDIMHESNFSDWFDFPVEDTDLHNTVLAAGIYSKSGDEEELHMHGVIFAKGLTGRSGMDLNAELQRLIHASEPLRVVHLLEESRFHYGLAGIITF